MVTVPLVCDFIAILSGDTNPTGDLRLFEYADDAFDMTDGEYMPE